ncbi:MAG: GGDEF domain-containing protein [Firmicutes bacterium]|nr:GGDEF domain-containing protein [Bacillota bacterium]
MKKFDLLKTIQLIVFIVFTVICALIVFLNKELFHTIAVDSNVKLMCAMLWLALAISFMFIFLDFHLFTKFKHDYKELDYVIHSDPVAGIANRFSSDALIDKYVDREVPEKMYCIMFELSNIREINQLYGHVEGNGLIRDFANILRMASVNLCFVARNGGNKYLAIFEEGAEDKLEQFLLRIAQKVRTHNSDTDKMPVEYKYGISAQKYDKASSITELIALSDRRI